MQKVLSVFIFCTLSLFAYSDIDLDGVDDAIDRCPNTSMLELVDMHGCTIQNLEGEHHFDVIMGVSYSQMDPTTQEKTDTLATSIQADYYYKSLSLQITTAYFNSESSVSSSGLTDTFVGAYYQLNPVNALSLRIGGGLLLPTYDAGYDNNNIDYTASASISYLLEEVNLFGSYSYTMINDTDANYLDVNGNPVSISYQNTSSFNAGLGFYPTNRLYLSGAYNQSQSIYNKIVTDTGSSSVEPLETASAYLFYTIDKHWFTTAGYAYGLSDSASDHYLGLRLGYYF